MMPDMAADTYLLGQLLTLAGLMAGTCEYSHLIRRRAVRRGIDANRRALESEGLTGLVRVFLVDPDHRRH